MNPQEIVSELMHDIGSALVRLQELMNSDISDGSKVYVDAMGSRVVDARTKLYTVCEREGLVPGDVWRND